MYGMNQSYNTGDPSGLVPNQILPHVHLVSSYRFPTLPTLQAAQALEYLIKGPTIVKDTSPVAWTYFPSPPPHGTVLLTWQPQRLGTTFASDGLVWADPEMVYDVQMRGYNLQVLVHKSGYHYPNEPFATHARFRYRITHGPGHIDANLWVVHYAMAEPANRIPSAQIPISREIHAQMQTRASLENAGQLIRKEFMLADRTNWPKVEFTRNAGAQQVPYYNPMQPGRPYNQPPPNKRARPNAPQQRQAVQPPAVADTTLEDEENSTQDSFDFLTPRQISLSRYKQHHEWMEEIFSSPYAVGKILPIDLGLGLMGSLAPLTAGILDAPEAEIRQHPSVHGDARKENYHVKSYNKLQPEQLKDFDARVAEYTKNEQAELEKMKAAHAKKMADLKRSRTYIRAERRLREVPRNASATDVTNEEEGADPLDSVVHELEKSLGVTFDTKKDVVCVDKGGFIEEQQAPQEKSQPASVNEATPATAEGTSNGLMDAIDAENSAASLLDQYGSNSLTGTPGANLSIPPISQPASQSQSAVATPSAPAAESTTNASYEDQGNNEAASSGNDLIDLDVEMSGMTNTEEKSGEGDWVMVDQAGDAQQPQQSTSTEQPATSAEAPAESTTQTSRPEGESATGIFDAADFGSFDNLDTAGDALADYTNVDDNMGLDLVDDSAFGDAFHGTEMHHGEGADGDTA